MLNSWLSSLITISTGLGLILLAFGISQDYSTFKTSDNLRTIPYGLAVDISMEYNLLPVWINHPKLFELFEIVRHGEGNENFFASGQIFDRIEANAFITMKQTVTTPYKESDKVYYNIFSVLTFLKLI